MSSLTALGLLPASGLLVDTPDLSQMTQVTAENDDVRSGTWYSPLRDGGVFISFGEDWSPEAELRPEDGLFQGEYYDDAQKFFYRGSCNWMHTVARLDEQDQLQFANSGGRTDMLCSDEILEDERELQSILHAESTTLHLDKEGDLWLVAGDDAMEMQRERPEADDLPGNATLGLSSMSSR